ncbi:hypothetical protein [Agaribacterium sp. ZY112]|uniref:hypothetical protein n=1 Tax=Agaribacterium sp. ZY112 TaxID=3233574 RepID=UPI003523AB8E
MTKSDFHVPSEHPCYKDHFPNNTLVPGALTIQWLIELCEQKGITINAVKSAKFLSTLHPGNHCQVETQETDSLIKIKLLREKQTIMQATLIKQPIQIN